MCNGQLQSLEHTVWGQILTFPLAVNVTKQVLVPIPVMAEKVPTPSRSSLVRRSPTFLAPGTGFVEDNFSTDRGKRGRWFRR